MFGSRVSAIARLVIVYYWVAHRLAVVACEDAYSSYNRILQLRQCFQKRSRLPSAILSSMLLKRMPCHGLRVRDARPGERQLPGSVDV
jgi:hypothetical protein